MKRLLFLAGAVLFLVVLGVGGWFAYDRYGSNSDPARLIGRWEGTGQSRSTMTIGDSKLPVTFRHKSKIEFQSDGTYVWEMVATSGGEGGSINLTLNVPKEGQPPPRWEIVQKNGKFYLQWHMNETELEFQGRDQFTISWTQQDDVGTETFRRVP